MQTLIAPCDGNRTSLPSSVGKLSFTTTPPRRTRQNAGCGGGAVARNTLLVKRAIRSPRGARGMSYGDRECGGAIERDNVPLSRHQTCSLRNRFFRQLILRLRSVVVAAAGGVRCLRKHLQQAALRISLFGTSRLLRLLLVSLSFFSRRLRRAHRRRSHQLRWWGAAFKRRKGAPRARKTTAETKACERRTMWRATAVGVGQRCGSSGRECGGGPHSFSSSGCGRSRAAERRRFYCRRRGVMMMVIGTRRRRIRIRSSSLCRWSKGQQTRRGLRGRGGHRWWWWWWCGWYGRPSRAPLRERRLLTRLVTC